LAITAYTGLPGSGKSYGVVENVILPALKSGRRIFTNIPLNADLVEKNYPGLVTQFTSAEILENPDWFQNVFQSGATLVIDECWRVWAAGLKANNMTDAHKGFLAEHRHMVGSDGQSTEVVYVTQDLAQIASYPRSLVETTYRAVKLGSVGANNKFRIDVYQGAVTGQRPSESLRLRQMFSSYKPDVYCWYKSQTMSQSVTHGDESGSDKRNNILNSWLFKFGFPSVFIVCILVFYYGFTSVSSMFGADEIASEAPVIETEKPAKVPVVSSVVAPMYYPGNHFYDGMTANIVYTTGSKPFQEFTLSFASETGEAVLNDSDLGQMGYVWIAYDECYGQLKRSDDVLHVYCKPDIDIAFDESSAVPDQFSGFNNDS